MVKYWVLGIIVAIVAAMFAARFVSKRKARVEPVGLPFWDQGQQPRPRRGSAIVDADPADTAPAVLSPSEEQRKAA